MTRSLSGAIEGRRVTPQTGRPSNAPHRVEEPDFSEGRCLCTCGVLVEVAPDPRYDRDEALALAWAQHRRDVGAVRAKFRGDVLEAM